MYGGIKLYMSPPKHERPKRATNIVVCDYQITNGHYYKESMPIRNLIVTNHNISSSLRPLLFWWAHIQFNATIHMWVFWETALKPVCFGILLQLLFSPICSMVQILKIGSGSTVLHGSNPSQV